MKFKILLLAALMGSLTLSVWANEEKDGRRPTMNFVQRFEKLVDRVKKAFPYSIFPDDSLIPPDQQMLRHYSTRKELGEGEQGSSDALVEKVKHHMGQAKVEIDLGLQTSHAKEKTCHFKSALEMLDDALKLLSTDLALKDSNGLLFLAQICFSHGTVHKSFPTCLLDSYERSAAEYYLFARLASTNRESFEQLGTIEPAIERMITKLGTSDGLKDADLTDAKIRQRLQSFIDAKRAEEKKLLQFALARAASPL